MTLPAPAVRLAAQARRIDTAGADGARIAWRLWRSEAPSPEPPRRILLLHGSFGSWTHWLRNIEALRSWGDVVAVDAPGFGDSDPPPDSTGPEPMAERLAAGWQQLQASLATPASGATPRLVIAGFSLGASHAACLARLLTTQRPGSVTGLLLVSPGGLGARPAAPGPVQRLRPDMSPAERLAAHRHNLAALMLADAAAIDETATLLQADNVERARFRGALVPGPDTVLDALPGLVLPTLAIWGGSDQWDPDPGPRWRALLQVAPRATVEVVPRAGHWAAYEAADQVNRTMLAWLQDL